MSFWRTCVLKKLGFLIALICLPIAALANDQSYGKPTCLSTHDEFVRAGLPPSDNAGMRAQLGIFTKALAEQNVPGIIEYRKTQLRQFVVAGVRGHPTIPRKHTFQLVAETASMLAGMAGDNNDKEAQIACQQYADFYREQALLDYPLVGQNTGWVNWNNVAKTLGQDLLPAVKEVIQVGELLTFAM